MSDNFRKLNIHFDIEAIIEAYNLAVEKIGFSGNLVNCISLTHKNSGVNDQRGVFWTMNEDYKEVQVERFVNEDAYKVFEPLLYETYLKNVYDVLSKHFKLGRIRILKLGSFSHASQWIGLLCGHDKVSHSFERRKRRACSFGGHDTR